MGAGKPKAKSKTSELLKPEHDIPKWPTPLTEEQKEWCVKFMGVPLEHCNLDDIPVPPSLNSAQTRIWKLMWERGQNHLKDERTKLGGPDDAMRKVLAKMNEGDPDTVFAGDHV